MNTERFRRSAGKPALISSMFIAAVLLICAGARPLCGAQHAGSATVNRAGTATPYTLTTRFHRDDLGAAATQLRTRVTARRADGAMVMLAYGAGETGAQASMRTIFYPDGRRVDVLDKFHAVTDWAADPILVAGNNHRFAASQRECRETPGQYVAGRAKLGRVNVVIVKQFPKGSAGVTWWRAPELGCAELQQTRTDVQADGSFRLADETKFVSIKLGPPDAAFFAIPKDYASIKPSQALRLWAKQAGQKWNSNLQAQAEQADAQYAHLQQASKSGH